MADDICYVIELIKPEGTRLPEELIRAHVAHLKQHRQADRPL